MDFTDQDFTDQDFMSQDFMSQAEFPGHPDPVEVNLMHS
jgi:hypothetical protein